VLRAADALLTISPATSRSLAENLGVESSKLHMGRNRGTVHASRLARGRSCDGEGGRGGPRDALRPLPGRK
jgi:hypothetical protein